MCEREKRQRNTHLYIYIYIDKSTIKYFCLYLFLYSTPKNFFLPLQKERILLFSYGSGLASSMFTLKVNKSTQDIKNNLNINEKLGQRVQVSAEKFDQIMQ